ncbi:catalase family protein [Nitrosomonas sp. Nm166]|uniref:catalase family protein n=1 Tax=Nitrosomonas sp. Nm166 TaxID=1881054 RepID=UPI0008F2711A|nr:catalase family protein [Nitrosomonas sp. Nm166]SFE11823.1 Catalase [Nitrosomonas sp. Nm166]
MLKGLLLSLALVPVPLIPTCAFSDELVLENEALAIQQISQLVEESIRSDAKQGFAHRNAHAKTHGCVKAQFHVLPLPDEMRVGIFAQAREYPVWIRYSNGSEKIQDDSVGDGRGMAIKLMDIEHSPSGTQDFVMFNHPVFFVRNAADYVEFQKALAEDSLIQFFFPDLDPRNFRLHELKIVTMIQNKKINNPLHTQYWSATPYRFGDTAIKFSARPCDKITYSLSRGAQSPNFLRENMQKHLDHEDACFNFMVQLRKHSLEMPIEDPTVEWNEKDSPFISVAKIIIPSQAFNTPEQLKFCEDLTFTPWHAAPDHQPLGGINRVRKAVYETSSRVRHELNGIERNEPASF